MLSAPLMAQSMHGKMMRDDLMDDRARKLQQMSAGAMNNEQIKKVAIEFESMFVSQMLEHMFGESSGEDLFGGSESDDVYKSMMVEQYGKAIVKSGGIGIAHHIEQSLMNRALLSTQEV